MTIQADRESAATLAQLRAERAAVEAARRRTRLAAAQYQEQQRLETADRFMRWFLGSLNSLGRPRVQPHAESLLTRESPPVRFSPRSRRTRSERRNAA